MTARSDPGKVTTFYSYKGGSGRTMALANVAWLLADVGKRVCVIDWDLEAPGLHRYFAPFLVDPELTDTDGLIDYVWTLAAQALTNASGFAEAQPDILDSVVGVEWPFERSGVIDFIPAGRQGPSYSRRVNVFDWEGFYDRLGGGSALQAARDRLTDAYDFVLIDSRTGVSDTSGICTVQMPDQLVACFTLNRQSIFGMVRVLEEVRTQRGEALTVFPLEMRVETNEKSKLEAARRVARPLLGKYLPKGSSDDYWTDVEIVYWPFYAFEEVLACFGDDLENRSRLQLLGSMERLATKLSGEKVVARTLTPIEREKVLRRYAFDPLDVRADEARLAESTDAYLHWLIDTHRYLHTAGIVSNVTVQIPLLDVFVNLSAIVDRSPGDRANDWPNQARTAPESKIESAAFEQVADDAPLDQLAGQSGNQRPGVQAESPPTALAVTDAVRGVSHLLVLGDPGCGKTTLLRYLALRHAWALSQPGTDSDRGLGEARLPIFLPIGDFARSPKREEGLGRFLAEYFESQGCQAPGLRDLLDKKLNDGDCLVLFDGLDDVGSAADRHAVVNALTSFVTANSRHGNRFVVTSRIAGYRAVPLPPVFQTATVQEMDDQKIKLFVEAYSPAVEQAEAPRRSAEAIRLAAAWSAIDLLAALRENAGVRRLAANPLLLTTLLLVHRARGRLPHRRVDAYVEITDALGQTWRSVHGLPKDALPDSRVLTTWLTRIGAWMHQYRPRGSANKREILEVLGPLWAKDVGSPWDPALLLAADPLDSTAGRSIEDFLEKTVVHTGLLVERTAGCYGFPHLTFEEYYAGRALAFEGLAADRPANMRSRLHDPRYDEPILLGIGLVGRVQPEEVERLVAEAILGANGWPTKYEELLGRDYLFALRVLADDVPLSVSAIDRLLLRALDEWFDPNSRCRFSKYRNALEERLVGLDSTRGALRLQAAMAESAAVRVRTNPGRFAQMALVLARLGPLSPEVVTALVATVNGAEDPIVRVQAAQALAHAQALTTEVVTALRATVTGANDPFVRVQAAQVLAQAQSLTHEVVTTLRTTVTGTDDPILRVQAAQVLAQAHALTHEVLAALVATVTGADDPIVRVQAAHVLAQAGALTQEVTTTLVATVAGADKPPVRVQETVTLLNEANPTPGVEAALVRLFKDDDSRVPEAAGTAMVIFAQRRPHVAPRIAGILIQVCVDPEFDPIGNHGGRPGWDYAYDALWSVAAVVYSTGPVS